MAVNNSSEFYLYRVFDFDTKLNKGKYYVMKGNLTNTLTLEALQYIAFPKPNDR